MSKLASARKALAKVKINYLDSKGGSSEEMFLAGEFNMWSTEVRRLEREEGRLRMA